MSVDRYKIADAGTMIEDKYGGYVKFKDFKFLQRRLKEVMESSIKLQTKNENFKKAVAEIYRKDKENKENVKELEEKSNLATAALSKFEHLALQEGAGDRAIIKQLKAALRKIADIEKVNLSKGIGYDDEIYQVAVLYLPADTTGSLPNIPADEIPEMPPCKEPKDDDSEPKESEIDTGIDFFKMQDEARKKFIIDTVMEDYHEHGRIRGLFK